MSVHVPVFLSESIERLISDKDGFYIDVTYGRGGHCQAILNKLSQSARVWGCDQDYSAVEHGLKLQENDQRFQIFHNNFRELFTLVSDYQQVGNVNGILIDAGVSSPQLDDFERGFSFQKKGPLDMRMNNTSGITAKEWLEKTNIKDIAITLREYGDVFNPKRWANLIKEKINEGSISTTHDLSQLIVDHTPEKIKRQSKTHPATKIFQAIRIAVNDELISLQELLSKSHKILKKGGVLVTISFHSLEHRLMRKLTRQSDIPIKLPIQPPEKDWKIISMLDYPSEQELQNNPRSRSARLSVLQKN